MFVAYRDLRFAAGRFALMTGVVALITVLVTFLAALTAGLARESTSAVADLPADHLAFVAADGEISFTASRVGPQVWESLAQEDGVTAAEPLGIATTRVSAGAGTTGSAATVTLLGVAPGTTMMPPDAAAPAAGTVVLTDETAEGLGAAPGDRVVVAGRELAVARVLDVDASYSHTPVAWVTLADWQALGGAAPEEPSATVVALRTDGGADLAGADARLGTTTVPRAEALTAIGSFAAENTSLRTMQGFLLVISALVVGSFFTVWTINRSADVAVLKALGASTRYLLRDAVAQALVVLVVGAGVGAGAASAAALALADVVPVVVSPSTVLVPTVVLVCLGLAGAALALRRLAAVDPHAALNAS
ncbi:putative ABC transport system permease protein [Georgenia soli]|uniref:Putative ABC transport system permease protein n=1 Tax=Georgenia soli TaxID=638953 RepID=A0A2A9EJR6_9MICO|nr:FtsX-like permease family protein [Georgenia soli]PFG38469.1 putative ABC transport system permease protein [Georgenia soli]